MSPAPDFAIKTGDSASDIYATLENSGGTPVDIEAATVAFKMASIAGGTTVINSVATNAQIGSGTATATVGDVVFTWGGTTAVPSTPGLYNAEWEVTFTNGSVQTFPNDGYSLILVTEDL